MTPLTSGSLASGGGIYRSLGSPFQERFAIEIDANAALAYQANYSDAAVWVRDASRPKVIEAAYKAFGPVDLITSGMPCQDFSIANSCDRINSEKNELYLSALDWVECFRPKAYIAENVANVAKQIQWDLAIDRLRSLGYRVVAWTLDARRFGVPQQRVRVFLIAIRDDYPLPVRPVETHGPGRLPYVTWSDAMRGMTEEEALIEIGRAHV